MRARRGHAIVSIIAAALLMAASAGADASRLAGDINCDGLADCNDVNPFLSLMGLPCSGTLPSGCPCANADCNGDGWITFADLACFLVTLDCSDCNGNLIDDAADIANCTGQAWCGDCNSNGVPDGCDIDPNDPDGDGLVSSDCNLNGVPDECEILPGDVNLDGVADCNDTNAFVARLNTSCGTCDWACWSADCDGNGLVTWRDIPGFWAATGCPDCNGNGVADPNDIAGGTSLDCNSNGIPDECDINPADPDLDGLVSSDCNSNGVPDECDTAVGTSPDCDTNGIPDECETTPTMLGDCNCDCLADCSDIDYFVAGLNDNVLAWQAHYSGAHGGQLPPCPFANLDCNGDGHVTWRDIPGFWAATGCPDCNGNGVADPNDIAGGTSLDCNSNGIPDECDINPADPDLDGLVSSDCNSNGVPDECDLRGDFDGDGTIDGGDVNGFAACILGPGVSLPPGCLLADMDGDGDADLVDVALFQAAL